ncbi:homeobox protein Nkx-6.3-like [Oryctolagus cuniculus]|uniref:homeobox protein Nkx-6.3-like n=1 Tax=Oryctolagus cuniculus TaxID=9986 RepID=UPI0038791ED9
MESNLQGTFLLNNTPLAQFSEMKAPVCQYSVQNSFYKLSPPGLGPQLAAGTPHGITDILSRPLATPNSSLLSSYPHVAGFGGLGSQGVYYGPQVGNFSKATSEYPARTRNCWADTGQDWRGGRQCSNREYGVGLCPARHHPAQAQWQGDHHDTAQLGALGPSASLSTETKLHPRPVPFPGSASAQVSGCPSVPYWATRELQF